jgi:hypothetical protein
MGSVTGFFFFFSLVAAQAWLSEQVEELSTRSIGVAREQTNRASARQGTASSRARRHIFHSFRMSGAVTVHVDVAALKQLRALQESAKASGSSGVSAALLGVSSSALRAICVTGVVALPNEPVSVSELRSAADDAAHSCCGGVALCGVALLGAPSVTAIAHAASEVALAADTAHDVVVVITGDADALSGWMRDDARNVVPVRVLCAREGDAAAAAAETSALRTVFVFDSNCRQTSVATASVCASAMLVPCPLGKGRGAVPAAGHVPPQLALAGAPSEAEDNTCATCAVVHCGNGAPIPHDAPLGRTEVLPVVVFASESDLCAPASLALVRHHWCNYVTRQHEHVDGAQATTWTRAGSVWLRVPAPATLDAVALARRRAGLPEQEERPVQATTAADDEPQQQQKQQQPQQQHDKKPQQQQPALSDKTMMRLLWVGAPFAAVVAAVVVALALRPRESRA